MTIDTATVAASRGSLQLQLKNYINVFFFLAYPVVIKNE